MEPLILLKALKENLLNIQSVYFHEANSSYALSSAIDSAIRTLRNSGSDYNLSIGDLGEYQRAAQRTAYGKSVRKNQERFEEAKKQAIKNLEGSILRIEYMHLHG